MIWLIVLSLRSYILSMYSISKTIYSDAEKGWNKLLHSTVVKSKNDFCRFKLGGNFGFFGTLDPSTICLRPFLQISAFRTTCNIFYKGFSNGRETWFCCFFGIFAPKQAILAISASKKILIQMLWAYKKCWNVQ